MPTEEGGTRTGITKLERVDHAEDLVKLTAGGGLDGRISQLGMVGGKCAGGTHGVREDQSDGLLGVNHVDGSYGEGDATGASELLHEVGAAQEERTPCCRCW